MAALKREHARLRWDIQTPTQSLAIPDQIVITLVVIISMQGRSIIPPKNRIFYWVASMGSLSKMDMQREQFLQLQQYFQQGWHLEQQFDHLQQFQHQLEKQFISPAIF